MNSFSPRLSFPGLFLHLEHDEVVESPLLKTPSRGKPGDARADDAMGCITMCLGAVGKVRSRRR